MTTKYLAADIPTATNTELTTLGGGRLYATKTAAGAVYINGFPLTRADISADNGVIHRINGILLPALGNLSQLAARDTSYSLLAAAVTRAARSNAALGTALTGTTPYTVFAPTNAAFRAAGFGSTSAIASADSSKLASILGNHVLTGRVFGSDLKVGAVPTVGGNSITFAQSGVGYTVAGSGNGSQAATIAANNSVATNGVFYSIDRVLLSAP
ncbi:MAG: fasciclin domain-containing protein [Sphingobacteriaceae bacterium]|nr:fasciclin domain-containing protein [Cytophagaceae bacterium]